MTVLLVLGVAAGALAQGSTGIGFALLAAPACALVLDAEEVVGTVVLLGLLVDAAVVAQAPRSVDLGLVRTYLLAAALAVPVAAGAVRAVDDDVLVAGSGALALLGAGAIVRAGHADVAPERPALRWVAGFASGFFGVTTGMSGPPVAIETARRRMPAVAARVSLAAFFLVVDATALAFNRRTVEAPLAWLLAAAVVVGLLAGRAVASRAGDARLRTALAVAVACSAVAAIANVITN